MAFGQKCELLCRLRVLVWWMQRRFYGMRGVWSWTGMVMGDGYVKDGDGSWMAMGG